MAQQQETFAQAYKNFTTALDNFDKDSIESIMEYNMSILYKTKAQILEEGGDFRYDVESFRNSIYQAIINRKEDNMAGAAFEYTEKIENMLFRESGLGYE